MHKYNSTRATAFHPCRPPSARGNWTAFVAGYQDAAIQPHVSCRRQVEYWQCLGPWPIRAPRMPGLAACKRCQLESQVKFITRYPRQPKPVWPAPTHWARVGGRRPNVGSSLHRLARPGIGKLPKGTLKSIMIQAALPAPWRAWARMKAPSAFLAWSRTPCVCSDVNRHGIATLAR